MTFRAKPVVKREHRPGWEAQDRRNFYLNLGFGLIVVLALLILGIYVGLSWYNTHLAAVGSVDGQSITKDQFRDRFAIDTWRLDEAEARIRTEVLAGHMTDAQGTAQESAITTERTSLAKATLERLVDTTLQAKLAGQEGITVTPADIDARLVVEATTAETRHSWVIAVAPATDLGAIGPTDAQKADAKAKAEAALKDIQGGKAWEDVAKTVSTDAATAPQAGDLGWIEADGHPGRRGVPQGGLRGPGQHADRGHRGQRRHLPDRPRDRDRSVDRGHRLPGQVPEQGHQPRPVPGRRRR